MNNKMQFPLRSRFVKKSSLLLEHCKTSFSLNEKKAINYLISKIKPQDLKHLPEVEYEFRVAEFRDLTRQKHNWTIKEIYNLLKNIEMQRCIEREEDKPGGRYKLLDRIRIDEQRKTIIITFAPYSIEYLSDVRGDRLLVYRIDEIMQMKSAYSLRLFEFLKALPPGTPSFSCSINEPDKVNLFTIIANKDAAFKPIIPQSWNNIAIFKRNILDSVTSEITHLTDLNISYSIDKNKINGRAQNVKFELSVKSYGQALSLDKRMDRAYKSFTPGQGYRSLYISNTINPASRISIDYKNLGIKQVQMQLIYSNTKKVLSAVAGRYAADLFAEDYIRYYVAIARKTRGKSALFACRLNELVKEDEYGVAVRIKGEYNLLKKYNLLNKVADNKKNYCLINGTN